MIWSHFRNQMIRTAQLEDETMCQAWYHGTAATWQPAATPTRPPDRISDSGSRYWLTADGVFRQSDHWGVVASCWWDLPDHVPGTDATGFCAWTDFSILVRLDVRRSGYLLRAGDHVSVLHAPRDRRGQTFPRRIRIKVARTTDCYVYDDDGTRYAQHTLTGALSIRS